MCLHLVLEHRVSIPVSQSNIFIAFYVRVKVRKLVAAEENLPLPWPFYLPVFKCDYIFVLRCPLLHHKILNICFKF